MQQYTVTITPDDGEGAQTIVRLEVNRNVPRIKELRLTAGRNGSLSTAQLPAINLEMLLAAVMPAGTTAPSIRPRVTAAPTTATAAVAPTVVAPTAAAEPAIEAVPAIPTNAPARTAAPKTARAKATGPKAAAATKTSTTAKAAPATKAAKVAKKPPATKSAGPAPTGEGVPVRKAVKKAARTSAKTAAKTKAAPPTSGTGSKDRAYRSMPEDFVSTYHQAPTVAALAEVYGVPVYTAQNWINTARKRDMIPAARSRRR